MKTPELKEKAKVITNILQAIGQTLKDGGATPNGVLYAVLMPYGISLEQYTNIIQAFKDAGKVHEINNLLYWIE